MYGYKINDEYNYLTKGTNKKIYYRIFTDPEQIDEMAIIKLLDESKNLLDLHFNPDVSKFGLTAWTDFDKIVKKGYYHAIEVLSKMSLEEINKFREEA